MRDVLKEPLMGSSSIFLTIPFLLMALHPRPLLLRYCLLQLLGQKVAAFFKVSRWWYLSKSVKDWNFLMHKSLLWSIVAKMSLLDSQVPSPHSWKLQGNDWIQPELLALGELEFRKAFMLLSYIPGYVYAVKASIFFFFLICFKVMGFVENYFVWMFCRQSLSQVITADEIRQWKNLPMVEYEVAVWNRLGWRYCSSKDGRVVCLLFLYVFFSCMSWIEKKCRETCLLETRHSFVLYDFVIVLY